MKQQIKYIVLQGKIKNSIGHMEEKGSFNNQKAAIKFFNKIKNDERGWSKEGVLTTQVDMCLFDEKNNYWFYERTIARHEKW